MATERSVRVKVDVRLAPEGWAEVRRLADEETEGNASAMLRKLLAEALARRVVRGRP